MSRQLADLETILQQLITEHRKLLAQVDTHYSAMRVFNLPAMDAARNQQEATRLRITGLETKRRAIVVQLARAARLPGIPTLSRVAELHPQRKEALMRLRQDLKETAENIARRTHVAGKLAGAVLGHLNTVVRLVAGAVEKAGLYTRNGVPQVSTRIGMMEAVG